MLPVTLAVGRWLSPLPADRKGAVDLIVSNPPYVTIGEWPYLPAEVRPEPRGALVAGDGTDGTPGLADVEAVLSEALAWLARPGSVVIELSPAQAGPGADMARSMGFTHVRTEKDLTQRERALVGRVD